MSRVLVHVRIEGGDAKENLPVRHFSRKQRAIAWISSNLFDGVTYTVRHGLLKGMKRKGGLGWLPQRFSLGTVTAEEEFWSGTDLRGMIVYDIGAFHGLLTVFFAARARTVVSFEPGTQNHQRLLENLRLNHLSNVDVRKVGVGSCDETRRLVCIPLFSGGASVDERAVKEILRAGVETCSEEISLVTLDEEIPRANLPQPDFIKIDTEGWELEALRGARNTLDHYRPALFLEMHGETIADKKRKVAEIVDFLFERNYRSIHHVETGIVITPENASLAKQGHLYCQAT